MMRNIAIKVECGTRLNESEALWLYQHAELTELGRLANRVNLRKNGNAVFYNINRHINPTNICALSCKFCAYSKKPGEEGGYAYEIDEMLVKAGEAVVQGATELHMVGGLHPRWNFQRYVDMIAAMHKAYPDVHLKAFTAVELDWMARKSKKTIKDVMILLRNAGLGSFPGGGAEIFHADVRDVICDTKVSGDQWIDTHRTAHGLGLRSNCTMLYGHIENYSHRVDHMRRLRDLQDETGGFNVFIPLAFQPFQNEMGVNRYTFGSDDLRTIAVARLYLDNFKHIKSYWVMLGQDIAQLALQFGANDLDGTVLEEKISRAAGGRAGMIMTRSNLENLIRRSGRIPVERTTLYSPVREEDRVHLSPVLEDTALNIETPAISSDLGSSGSNKIGKTALNHDEDRAADTGSNASFSGDNRDMLLALENGETISPSNLWKVAMTAPLHAVTESLDASTKMSKQGQTLTESIFVKVCHETSVNSFASTLRQALIQAESTSLTENAQALTIVLDASGVSTPIAIIDFISAAKAISLSSPVVLRGVSSLLAAAQAVEQKPTEYLASLRIAGLDVIEESCADDSLSNADKWLIFGCAQAAEIAVIPLITLKSLTNAPDWSSWADDVTEIRTRLASNDLIFGVSLRVADNHLLMPSEYMKAVALTRLSLPNATQLWTPICGMSVLSPLRGLGAESNQHPVMKLVSASRAFGSASLGFVAKNEFNLERICEDLQASGATPRLTCPRQNTRLFSSQLTSNLSGLRHIPSPSARG
jgi:aminodeoxyfutalosine synthase